MSKWEVSKSELISLKVTVLLIVFPALSQCARYFLCLMFAVNKSWCKFLLKKKVERWSWSIWLCSAHHSTSPKVDRGIIPKSPFPYSISDVLASPGTAEHLHHSHIDSYNTIGKQGRENLLLVLPTRGWKDFLGMGCWSKDSNLCLQRPPMWLTMPCLKGSALTNLFWDLKQVISNES